MLLFSLSISVFFFFKQKTAYEMRISDWSSDVCSSDLITVLNDASHVMADGRRFLVIHVDDFDGIVQYAKWLALLGDRAYGMMIWLNHWFNQARRRLGYDYWSLSAYLKLKVKNAVEYVNNFETAIADEARRRGVDGVI